MEVGEGAATGRGATAERTGAGATGAATEDTTLRAVAHRVTRLACGLAIRSYTACDQGGGYQNGGQQGGGGQYGQQGGQQQYGGPPPYGGDNGGGYGGGTYR